jgi:hypothetical protein
MMLVPSLSGQAWAGSRTGIMVCKSLFTHLKFVLTRPPVEGLFLHIAPQVFRRITSAHAKSWLDSQSSSHLIGFLDKFDAQNGLDSTSPIQISMQGLSLDPDRQYFASLPQSGGPTRPIHPQQQLQNPFDSLQNDDRNNTELPNCPTPFRTFASIVERNIQSMKCLEGEDYLGFKARVYEKSAGECSLSEYILCVE